MWHVGFALTRSVAVAVTVIGTILLFGGQSVDWLGWTLVTEGGVVSRTRTVKVPIELLEWVSWDEQVTVVVPNGKVAPDVGAHITGRAPSTRSIDDT